jgi:putative FmdB family regulatory protein
MPIYEYECANCKFYTELIQKISDAPLKKCPSCGKSALKKLISAPVFRLKGGGWYETDFKSDKEAKRNLAGDGGESADSKAPVTPPATEAKAGDSKSESKPAADKAASGESGSSGTSRSSATSGDSGRSGRSGRSGGKAAAAKPAKPVGKAPTRKSAPATRAKVKAKASKRRGR